MTLLNRSCVLGDPVAQGGWRVEFLVAKLYHGRHARAKQSQQEGHHGLDSGLVGKARKGMKKSVRKYLVRLCCPAATILC